MAGKNWFKTFLLLSSIALIILAVFNHPVQVAASLPTQQMTPQPERVIPHEQALINHYESELNHDELDPQMVLSLREKLAMAKNQVNAQIRSQSNSPDQGLSIPSLPKTVQDPGFNTGIYEGGEGIFRPDDAVIQNYWQGIVDDLYVQVFAGSLGTEAAQGLVIVITTSDDRLHSQFQRFLSPDKKGWVRVLSEKDYVLTLVCSDGSYYGFEVKQKQFFYPGDEAIK